MSKLRFLAAISTDADARTPMMLFDTPKSNIAMIPIPLTVSGIRIAIVDRMVGPLGQEETAKWVGTSC